MCLEIVPFEPRFGPNFRDLNLRWIKRYFWVEPKDIELLENVEKSIIDTGGYIYLAKYKGGITGCFALIKQSDTVYELGKMAVDPQFQGLKIGQKLLTFAIDFAKKKQLTQIVLYSSTKLDTALYIYRKVGFKEVEIEKEVEYKRSNIKMVLDLN